MWQAAAHYSPFTEAEYLPPRYPIGKLQDLRGTYIAALPGLGERRGWGIRVRVFCSKVASYSQCGFRRCG
jgi:hypothetical protein